MRGKVSPGVSHCTEFALNEPRDFVLPRDSVGVAAVHLFSRSEEQTHQPYRQRGLSYPQLHAIRVEIGHAASRDLSL
jgi:hypothetical protein